MVNRCRAWLVDLDGTLYRSIPVKLWMAFRALMGGPRVWRVIAEFRRQHERIRGLEEEPGRSPFERQIEATAEQLKLPKSTIRKIVEEWMIERPGYVIKWFANRGLIKEIERFREAGGRTAVVSDYPARRKLECMGIEALFDVVIANGEPDGPTELKPDPEGYLKAADRLKRPPGECLVIGDRGDTDGIAAERAGMTFRLIR